jgi:hypothetical protein
VDSQLQAWPTNEIFVGKITGKTMTTYVSPVVTIASLGAGGLTTLAFAHGLGVKPNLVRIVLVCLADDAGSGLVVGQNLDAVSGLISTNYFSVTAVGEADDDTNIYVTSTMQVDSAIGAVPNIAVGNEAGYGIIYPGGGYASQQPPTSFGNFGIQVFALAF